MGKNKVDGNFIKFYGIIIFIIILILLFFGRPDKKEACMIGCIAGMNYNGTFNEIDTNNISGRQLKEFNDCDLFCTNYERLK